MDTAQGHLPQALPLARRTPGPALASRHARRSSDRRPPRRVLPWLLLDADGAAVRRRPDEPRLGRTDHALRAIRKDDALGRADEPPHRRAPYGLGRCQSSLDDLNMKLTLILDTAPVGVRASLIEEWDEITRATKM